jgi:hypothetical protein
MFGVEQWVTQEEKTMSILTYILVQLLVAVMTALKVGLCGLALVLPAKMVMQKRGRK